METRKATSEDRPTPESPTKIAAGYSHEGLTLTRILESTEQKNNANNLPDIDIVHVMALCAEEGWLSLQALLPRSVTSTKRREFVFRCNIDSLLVGDFTSQSIDSLARKLLRSLIFFQQHDAQQSTRAIMFVAYDFGALIVKKAICIAGSNQQQWPGIFMSTARFIFSGCFQRASSIQILRSKIFDYLVFQRNFTWGQSITTLSINSIAEYVAEITEAFVASKITLRSQVVSLYTDATRQGKIPRIFDFETATIGVPDEVTIQEQTRGGEEQFPGLCAKINDMKHWIPHESWIPIEQTLLALTPAHPLLSSARAPDSWSTEHDTWMASAGARILYIKGCDYNGVVDTAEQLLLRWRFKQREANRCERIVLPFCFVFSSCDPMRRSMKDMLCSFLLSVLANTATGTVSEEYNLMRDLLVLQHAWTEMDLFKFFTALSPEIIGREVLFLLQNIDECDKESRRSFWTMLNAFAATTERPFKVVVTCKRSFDLSDELRQWPFIPVDTYTLDDKKKDLNGDAGCGYPDNLISMLCPGGYGEDEIRQRLEVLRPMKSENLDAILKLIMVLTDWPQETSKRTLDEFCCRLRAVTLASTPADILDRALRDIPDQDGLRWILEWILTGQRPLSYDELAMVLCYCKRGESQNLQTPSALDLQDSVSRLQIWLHGITESCSSKVAIREGVRKYFQDGSKYIWADFASSDAIMAFLLDYLSAPEIQQRLDFMSSQYQVQIQSSSFDIMPPLIPDGKDIIFYAIQALPYHLSQNPNVLRTMRDTLMATNGKLMSWSRVYWAMSNPFSRPKFEALRTPYETLLALGNLAPEAVAIVKEMQSLADSATVDIHGMSAPAKALEMDSLPRALREGNEDVALSLAREFISASKKQIKDGGGVAALEDGSKIAWPSWFLWRAVWLNMDRLVVLLLSNGMDPDPEDNGSLFFPSPLHMAARLYHPRILDALVEYGAKLDVKAQDMYNVIYSAAIIGNVHGIDSLVAKNKSLLEERELDASLFVATTYGNWNVVRRLLELRADLYSGIGKRPDDSWAPLVVAAELSNIKTAQILLKHKANPNICGPDGQSTPLWFSTVYTGNVDMLRLLLNNGANPNHDLGYPLLLSDIIAAPTLPTSCKLAILDVLSKSSTPALVSVTGADGTTPLLHAAAEGDLAIVRWLLEHEADVNATDNLGFSALSYAISMPHPEVIRELLHWKPKLNIMISSGDTLLDMAIKYDSVHIVKLLLDAGADAEFPNRDKQTAISTAVSMRKPEVVKLLVDRKVDLHHRDSKGRSPIMIATRDQPDADIVRFLAEGGANLGDADLQSGYTPLHYAMTQNIDIARVLLEFRKNLDLEKRNINGRTPLLVAIWNDRVEHVKLLIRSGADINAQDDMGWTALSYVANRPPPLSLEVADCILSQPGMEIDAMGHPVGSALIVACRSLNHEMVAKFLERGADPNMSTGHRPIDTALKAACMPWGVSEYNETMSQADIIIRTLVTYGADVNAVGGSSIYNAISAACFSSGSSIIRLLFNGWEIDQGPDPLGRYPIHFAAANGIKNFGVMSRFYKGDMMASDCAGKNVLHWAAQFGHVKTIEAILGSMGASITKRMEYINKGDDDGWTPLCWATRPLAKGHSSPNLNSEPCLQKETVKYLIEQGADLSVKFTMGTGENTETFTLAQMAKLCNVEDDIVNMLDIGSEAGSMSYTTPNRNSGDTNKPYRRYRYDSTFCHACFNTIFGHQYECQSCPEFYVCKKCYGRIDIYHGHFKLDDGSPHSFALRKGCDMEFQDLSNTDPSINQVRSKEGNRLTYSLTTDNRGVYYCGDEQESVCVGDEDDSSFLSLDLGELEEFESDYDESSVSNMF